MLDHSSRLEFKLAIIRSRRKQFEIAEQLGINENRLSQFLHGRRNLSTETIDHLQEILGMVPAGAGSET